MFILSACSPAGRLASEQCTHARARTPAMGLLAPGNCRGGGESGTPGLAQVTVQVWGRAPTPECECARRGSARVISACA